MTGGTGQGSLSNPLPEGEGTSVHVRWLRQYARGVRRAARRVGDAKARAELEDSARRLLGAAGALEGQAVALGERGRFADFARVDEVAGRLGIHVESARRLMRAGKLPAVRVGMLWLMERGELERVAAEYEPQRKWG